MDPLKKVEFSGRSVKIDLGDVFKGYKILWAGQVSRMEYFYFVVIANPKLCKIPEGEKAVNVPHAHIFIGSAEKLEWHVAERCCYYANGGGSLRIGKRNGSSGYVLGFFDNLTGELSGNKIVLFEVEVENLK